MTCWSPKEGVWTPPARLNSFASTRGALAFMVTSVVWGTILGVFFAAVSALGALLLGFLSTMGS